MFVTWSKIDIPSTAMCRCSNRLVLLDSELKLQILQQLQTMLMSLMNHWPTTWHQQPLTIQSNSKRHHFHLIIHAQPSCATTLPTLPIWCQLYNWVNYNQVFPILVKVWLQLVVHIRHFLSHKGKTQFKKAKNHC